MPISGVFNPCHHFPAPSPASIIRRLGLSGIPWSESDESFPKNTPGGPILLKRKIQVQSTVLQHVRNIIASDDCFETHLPCLTTAVGSNGVTNSIVELSDTGEPVFIRQTSWPHLDQFISDDLLAAYCERVEMMNTNLLPNTKPVEVKLFETVRRDMNLMDTCAFQEKLVKVVASALTADDVGGENMTRLDRMIRSDHPRVTYREAIGILRRRGFSVEFGYHLGAKYEGALLHYAGYLPIHITHFPGNLKPFNIKLRNGDESTTESAEYLFPFAGRIAESAELESNPEILRNRLYNGPMYKRIMKQLKELINGEPQSAGNNKKTAVQDLLEHRAQTSVQGDFENYISRIESRPQDRACLRLCAGRLLQYILGSKSVADAITTS